MLTSPWVKQEWSKVVSQDVRKNVEELQSKVFMVAGHVKGKTMLPLPVGAENSDYVEELERCVFHEF